MRIVLQRVSRAEVRVAGEVVGRIDRGWLALVGVARGDEASHADYLAAKVAGLRGFADEAGKMNRSVVEVGGAVLVVSQFTLLGDCRAGRRPSFTESADPVLAETLYERFIAQLRTTGLTVATGVFRAEMEVELVNDGPVTFLLESR
ncbi:D-tyrosyl-tRNA(Tyr) deacylase [Isosphaera pallida ATCC 43644]|jgi:D-tyrosyl-tRNA(Tyr) deacylase|uniref:D-aminoacyl-tRNA deacylase n=1 Tax=Isosphaera pallida (strain ATCC 43644 / DSM 9630 / IS1B) TaxID=575540 RepID=E8QXJ9_ISOPI|nr:D-aminoacyl-tRNA deacylase [Isosphaera pallida]ADV63047.1 D-tyrosyl-tRNA(Tyr) deacylase [Isosphaera pallida ATCC 43644]